MFFRKPVPVSTLAETLVESTIKQLPLPVDVLIENSTKSFDDPAELMMLANAYSQQKNNLAWVHLFGEILRLKQMYEKMILIGERDRFGVDLTPSIRASYGTLLQILAIPAQVQKIHKGQEEALMGQPQLEKFDFSTE